MLKMSEMSFSFSLYEMPIYVEDVKDRSNTHNAMYVEDVEDGKRTYTHIFAHNFLNIPPIFNLQKVLESWDLELFNHTIKYCVY